MASGLVGVSCGCGTAFGKWVDDADVGSDEMWFGFLMDLALESWVAGSSSTTGDFIDSPVGVTVLVGRKRPRLYRNG